MPRAPEPADDDLGALFMRVARRVRRRWVDVLEPWGLSPHQSRALGVVGQHEPVRPGVIAGHLRIAPRSATDVLDGLEGLGLVERRPDPEDRRAQVVHLTTSGRRLLDEVGGARRDDLAEFFGHLPVEDRASLTRILRALEDDD